MADAPSNRPSLGRRLFILARLAAAWLMWANMAIIIGIGNAEAGVPANTPEWNRTWEDFRRWALNPPRTILTPIRKVNLEYGLPAGLLVYSWIPVRILTNRIWLIAACGVIAWALSTWLTVICYKKEKGMGDQWTLGLKGSLLVNSLLFIFFYGLVIIVTWGMHSP